MKKNLGITGLLVSLLMATLGTSATTPARAESPLYISSDYTFTADIDKPIVVTADNIVINGSGYVLQGSRSGEGEGISITGKSNITIIDVTVQGWRIGIWLEAASSNHIVGTSIITNSQYGIWIGADSTNNSIVDNFIGHNNIGIGLKAVSTTKISENNINDNYEHGFELEMVSNTKISGNLIIDNGQYGVILKEVSSTEIDRNIISDNSHGIRLETSSNITIDENIISNNAVAYIAGTPIGYGVSLEASPNNTIVGNYIADNGYGVKIANESINNVIYHNTFEDNIVQADDINPTTNHWYHPELLEGNYWSDYPGADDGSGTGKHAITEDKIGDTNLPWPDNDYDTYPLIQEDEEVDGFLLEGFDQANNFTSLQLLIGFGLGFGLIFFLWAFRRFRK